MMLCSLLSYLDRQILAILSPSILAETHMNVETYTNIVLAFSVAYMIGNPFWGAVIDRIGLRVGMSAAVGIWTVASASHAVMSGFAGFAAARAVLGFGEGATFPGGLRTAMDSLPPEKQSRGIALAYSGGSLGAILTPLLVVPLAAAWGWRAAFWLTALTGLVWILVWRMTVHVPLIRSTQFALPNVFERRFWIVASSYALGGFPLAPILYLAPIYLTRAHSLTQTQLGYGLWIPPLGWEVGYFVWGWFTDRFAPESRRPVWLFVLLALLGLPVIGVTAISSTIGVLAVMFWSMFVSAGYVVVSLRSGALWYSREQTGVVAGIGAGSWSAVTFLLPLMGRLFDLQRYSEAFLIVGLVPAAGTLIWWILTLSAADRRD